MDNYTKMCNCPEIQDGWKPKVGDRTQIGRISAVDGLYKGNLIFKPSIEQLMGMVDIFMYEYLEIVPLHKDTGFVLLYCRSNSEDQLKVKAISIQELGLAFVMHELHNKKWDSDKWTA